MSPLIPKYPFVLPYGFAGLSFRATIAEGSAFALRHCALSPLSGHSDRGAAQVCQRIEYGHLRRLAFLNDLPQPRVPADHLSNRATVLAEVRGIINRNQRYAVDLDHCVVGDHPAAVDSELERTVLAL